MVINWFCVKVCRPGEDKARMASRLKLRKKKCHPPSQESSSKEKNEFNKKNDEQTKTNIKSYAQVVSSSARVYDENEIFAKAIASAEKHKIKIW